MKLTRFALGIALLAAAIMISQLLTEPLLATGESTQYRFLWLLSYGIGGVAGALAWGLIIWLPLRLIRGAEYAPDPLKVSLYTAAIIVCVFIVFRLIASPYLSQEERKAFIAGMRNTCFPTQRSSPLNATMTDTEVAAYCSCIALSLSERFTKKDFEYFEKNNSFSPSAKSKTNIAAEECRQELFAR